MKADTVFSLLVQGAALCLPWGLRRRILNGVLGYSIDRKARIGFSLVLAKHVSLSEGASIGHLNAIYNLSVLKMGRHARISNQNRISGVREDTPYFRHETGRISALEIGDHAAITNKHRIDCTNTVRIGAFTTVAGFGSYILTHSIDLKLNRQSSAPVEIGPYCFIGTCAVLLKGSSLGGYSVLGAGSVLRTSSSEEYCLMSGVPAEKVKNLDKDMAYFSRTEGHVW